MDAFRTGLISDGLRFDAFPEKLTGDDTADATMAGPLVAGSGGMIRRVFADGAYDGEPVTKAIREARPPNSPPEIIIPPRATSIPPPARLMADRNGSTMRRRSRRREG